jgi:hypothetical protein
LLNHYTKGIFFKNVFMIKYFKILFHFIFYKILFQIFPHGTYHYTLNYFFSLKREFLLFKLVKHC